MLTDRVQTAISALSAHLVPPFDCHADDIAALIDAADALEGDADLEAPMGAPEVELWSASNPCGVGRLDQTEWARGASDEREGDADFEPSLAARELHPRGSGDFCPDTGFCDQSRWFEGDTQELEADHDGREPDDEADLVTPHRKDQRLRDEEAAE